MNILMPNDVRPLPNVVWNLFLAVVPVFLAFWAARMVRRRLGDSNSAATFPIVLVLIVWASFLPNTCYLLTEWRHYIKTIAIGHFYPVMLFDHQADIRLLISTAFYIFYSGSGLVAFFMAVWPLDRIVRERVPRTAETLKILIFALCALGVYLGLIHRYNSWQLIEPSTLPSILHTTWTIMSRPFATTLILAFTVVLWLLYIVFDIWMDGLCLRLSRRSTPLCEG